MILSQKSGVLQVKGRKGIGYPRIRKAVETNGTIKLGENVQMMWKKNFF